MTDGLTLGFLTLIPPYCSGSSLLSFLIVLIYLLKSSHAFHRLFECFQYYFQVEFVAAHLELLMLVHCRDCKTEPSHMPFAPLKLLPDFEELCTLLLEGLCLLNERRLLCSHHILQHLALEPLRVDLCILHIYSKMLNECCAVGCAWCTLYDLPANCKFP